MFKKLKKFYYTKILHKKYYRVGACKGCGRCCKQIYVKHARGVIKEEKDLFDDTTDEITDNNLIDFYQDIEEQKDEDAEVTD